LAKKLRQIAYLAQRGVATCLPAIARGKKEMEHQPERDGKSGTQAILNFERATEMRVKKIPPNGFLRGTERDNHRSYLFGGCFCLSLSACLSDFPLLWVFYQSSFALRLFQYVFDLRTELTSPRNGIIFKNSSIPSQK